jgi:malonyl CoA-acyl carrier protein transacylase
VCCSYPLVGLTQLAHYVSTLAKLGKTHEEMAFKGATGHSQGVASAVVLASSATTAELNANALKMVRGL